MEVSRDGPKKSRKLIAVKAARGRHTDSERQRTGGPCMVRPREIIDLEIRRNTARRRYEVR